MRRRQQLVQARLIESGHDLLVLALNGDVDADRAKLGGLRQAGGMSKEVSTALLVAVMVLAAGLVLNGFAFDARSVVAVIFAICGGFITWIYMQTNTE